MIGLLFCSLVFAETGTVSLFAFGSDRIPAKRVLIRFVDEEGKEQTHFTDDYGGLLLSLEEGKHHVFWGNREEVLEVRAGDQSELFFSATLRNEVQLPIQTVVEGVQKEETPLTALVGTVLDWDEQPIADAQVLIRGRKEQATTNAQGQFSILVPDEPIDLVIFKEGFVERNMAGFQVSEDELRVLLSPAGYQLEELSIVAPRIEGNASTMLAQRKQSSTVGEQLGAEQMSKAGDSDAASALKRVTGLTVVGGKYVYVRGLGERYSASLLNGSTLPSTEPERRVVPLDLFPTSLLKGITIQKTFSPERPAEFGGGVVSLETRGIPEEPMFRIGVSSGYTEGATGLMGDMGTQYALDWTGFGAGSRALPGPLEAASSENPLEERDMFSTRGYTAEELEGFGESIDAQRWSLEERMALPPIGLDIFAGRGWDVGGVSLGVLAAGLWKNDWDLDSFDRSYYLLGEEGALEESHVYNFEEMSNNIRLSGALITEASWDGGSVSSTTLLNRSSDLRTRWYEGFNRDVATDIKVLRTGWTERMLFFQQFRGLHSWNKWNLDWRYAYSQASRQEPDRREYRYDYEPGTDSWYLSDRPEGNSIFYSTLMDHNHDWTVQLSRTMNIVGDERESVLRMGMGGLSRNRGVDTRRYKFMHKGPNSYDSEILEQQPDAVFQDKTIGSNGFQFEEVTRQTDNYQAEQRISSAFLMLDAKFGGRWGALTGLRLENSVQNVETFALFSPDQTPVLASLDNLDVLPALTLSYDIGPDSEPDQMRLRAGYGRTLSRPDFRELSPATFNDVTGGRQVYGNPDLKRALIDNLDLRWEWYPTPEESLSIGAFYKDFDSPIESIVVVSAQHSVTYQNAERANNRGLEIDGRIGFERIHPQLNGMFVGANASWIHSNVTLGENSGIQSSDVRALEGQSPYVYNLQFSFEEPDGLWGSTVLYNVFGPRIMQVGALGAPDYLELPVHRVDWVSFVNSGDFRWGIRLQNLLDAPIRVQTGDVLIEKRQEGRSLGVQLRWTPSGK